MAARVWRRVSCLVSDQKPDKRRQEQTFLAVLPTRLHSPQLTGNGLHDFPHVQPICGKLTMDYA